MELRHLRYFAAVAEELNYRKAAERLRVAQPALSSQIKDLEQEIGVRLLDRDTGGVQLTDAGAAFLAEVRLILAHAQRAVAVAHEAAQGRRGRLVVGYFAPLLLGLIPAALKSFHEEFPEVEVTLAEMPLGEQLAALRSGAIQIGFSVGGNGPAPRGLLSTRVASTPIRAVIGRSHRLARVRAIALADLAQERLLSFVAKKDAPSVHGAIMRERFAARGITIGPIREIEGPEAFRATLESGQGVSLIAELSSFSRSWDLVFKPLKETGTDLFVELHALWRGDQSSQLTANFIRHLSRIKPPARRRPREA